MAEENDQNAVQPQNDEQQTVPIIGDNKNTAGDRPEWSVSGNRTVRSHS